MQRDNDNMVAKALPRIIFGYSRSLFSTDVTLLLDVIYWEIRKAIGHCSYYTGHGSQKAPRNIHNKMQFLQNDFNRGSYRNCYVIPK